MELIEMKCIFLFFILPRESNQFCSRFFFIDELFNVLFVYIHFYSLCLHKKYSELYILDGKTIYKDIS